MQQTTLELDDGDDVSPAQTIAPEHRPPLIALMAEAIVMVWQYEQETDHDAV